MDTILFKRDGDGGYSKPNKWIYTDLLGRVQYKDIENLSLEEVIKAFLTNLKHTDPWVMQNASIEQASGDQDTQNGQNAAPSKASNKGEFSNEDLLNFFGNSGNPFSELSNPSPISVAQTVNSLTGGATTAGDRICFALYKNRRQFMNISDLCDIKQKYPNGIDAL